MTSSLRHQFVSAPGARLHVAELGAGPLVLFVHGFPEGWWSWRHQLPAVAAAGFRAAAIDLRGYGRSSAPAAVDEYRSSPWWPTPSPSPRPSATGRRRSSATTWDRRSRPPSALLRPDVFTAVGLSGVPTRRPAPRPERGLRGRGAAARSSTSATSRRRAGPRARSSRMSAVGSPASTPRSRARRQRRGVHDPAWRQDARPLPRHSTSYPRGSTRRSSTPRRESSGTAVSRARSTATATSTVTGRTWRRGRASRSGSRQLIFIAGAQDASTVWLADAIAAQATTLPWARGLALARGLRPLGPPGTARRGQRPARALADASVGIADGSRSRSALPRLPGGPRYCTACRVRAQRTIRWPSSRARPAEWATPSHRASWTRAGPCSPSTCASRNSIPRAEPSCRGHQSTSAIEQPCGRRCRTSRRRRAAARRPQRRRHLPTYDAGGSQRRALPRDLRHQCPRHPERDRRVGGRHAFRRLHRQLRVGGRVRRLPRTTDLQRGEGGSGVSLTRSLAVELAPDDITVNAVAPGWVDTPGNRATGRMADAARTIPLGRVAQPEEIAEWVWRLAGE